MARPEPIRVQRNKMSTKHDQIADRLTDEILSGRWRSGDRLPSERELAARFDANRGAVREAMKSLAQLGIASIQPGGARVAPLEHASLDVIGHMLKRSALPDPALVDQILCVINALINVAAETVARQATDAELASVRRLVEPLVDETLPRNAHNDARLELMRTIMLTSGNLVCQLIARTLFEQLAPHIEPLRDHFRIDRPLFAAHARALDQALAARDADLVRSALTALAALNRDTMLRAFEDAEASSYQAEVAAS
jgi:GntR family transcriptional repressor for pyruvate dehydrogenase complex